MSQIYDVLKDGSNVLPVANGVLVTNEMLNVTSYGTGVFVIAFYDANGAPVTPTAGSINPEASPIPGQWHTPSSGDATISATSVVAGSAVYAIPVFTGPVTQGRITLAGIIGATTCKAYFWRE
ncbi:MAG: hypothetical protein JKY14_13740 [Paraglaciecola sp.]|nr:hypothetical protein [Paraglaciecola sp.]